MPAGGNVSLLAQLNAEAAPTITPLVNDVSPVAAGEARLVVRHTAAAPAVDVRAGELPVLPGLTNPNEAAVTVPAGTVSADVVPAGASDPVIGPADLPLAAVTATAEPIKGCESCGPVRRDGRRQRVPGPASPLGG